MSTDIVNSVAHNESKEISNKINQNSPDLQKSVQKNFTDYKEQTCNFESLCKAAASLMQKDIERQESIASTKETKSYGFLDIWEDKTKFLFLIDAPGLIKENIDISISGNYLNVKTSRETTLQPEETIRYSERKNMVDRSILLPPNVNVDNISCAYKDGVIQITLLKLRPDADLVKKIPISYYVFS